MKGEIPEFRRCCFCLPLRYGLLAWGYFKIIADVCLILSIAYSFVFILLMIRHYKKADDLSSIYPELIVTIIAIAVFLTDLIVTILFIVGAHKKNVQLLRVFYFQSMGMWVATFLLASFMFIISIKDFYTYGYPYRHLGYILMNLCLFFVILVVQTYFLLLLRSEIIKLRKSGEFRFVNNAAEAECTMRCEEVVVTTETVKPDE